MDLISTIDEQASICEFSEESDVETDYQPMKFDKTKEKDFNAAFSFDLSSKNSRKTNKSEQCDKSTNQNDQITLSDDELKEDILRNRIKKSKKTKNGMLKEKDQPEIENSKTEVNEVSSFYQMNLSRPLIKTISALGYSYPTPIQASAIPIALLGRDIYACAATGTGKTAAFMLPTIERLLYKPLTNKATTRVLVLVPTRELGAQVYQVTKQLCKFTSIDVGLAIGGVDVKAQEAVLRQNPDVVIATPGRLIDHIKNTPSFSLASIEVLILDEADRMLDQNFAEQMKEIIKSCSKTRQTMLFSATMNEEIENLATVSLNKPVKIFMDTNQTVAFNLRQEFVRIREDMENDREPILASLICRIFHENCIVFTQTKKQAHRLLIILKLLGIQVGELHGNLSQHQRLESLKKFKSGEINVLVATDVAARGLDIFGVKTVINYDMPKTTEQYIHRVGRTARAGRAGVSVSLAGEHERKIVKEIIKNTKSTVKNRIVLPKIIEKYRIKLNKLKTEIENILNDEKAEKEIKKTEQKLSNIEKKLTSSHEEKRSWFQTPKQRKEEQKNLALKFKMNCGEKTNSKEEKVTRNREPPGKIKRKKRLDNKVKRGSKLSKNFDTKPKKGFENSSFARDLTDVHRNKPMKKKFQRKGF